MNIVTLSNGKRVANFSSPHPFEFEDGSILPAVPEEIAQALKVDFIEKEEGNGDVTLTFELPTRVLVACDFWKTVKWDNKVDVVFVPLPMLTALKQYYTPSELKTSPFRAIRMIDRVNKKVSITKQCL